MQSLFSTNWYRVSTLQPRLRDGIGIKRQYWRNQLWYLLTDESSGRQHRINAAAYQFIGRCNGKPTVQQVWDTLLLDHVDAAPTQDEVIQLLIQLNQLELLQCAQTPDTAALFRRHSERTQQKRRLSANPFALRMPLGDPAPWLNRLDFIAQAIFRPAVFFVWLTLILIAVLLAGSEWDALYTHGRLHMLTPRYLTISLICFPLIKALHELGHGLAVRRWGGEVHEVGISLLIFVPAPYVDASAASAFPLRGQRATVSAAGILVETSLAAFALLIWMNTQPGLVQDIAFVVMVIGTVSTLLFNGNPLLRFDGYYVMSDLLDIPNLATRSNQYWSNKMRSFMLRRDAEPLQLAQGEQKWLFLYAPLSFAYRLVISWVIVLWLGAKWFLLGLLAAIYLLFNLLLQPAFRWVSQWLAAGRPGAELTAVRYRLALLSGAILLLFFVLPIPFTTIAPAVVWLPEQSQIRPQIDGFIQTFPMRDGAQVKVGDILAILKNPELNKSRAKLASRLDGLRADQYQLLLSDPAKAQNITEEIASIGKEIARVDEQIANLRVTAQVAGTLVMPQQADTLGTFVHRGDNMGYVFETTSLRVRAAVAEKDAYLVRNNTHGASVWLLESPYSKYPVRMTMDIPAATRLLPSPALGDRAGGQYVTDPADNNGTATLEPIFLFDLMLDGSKMKRVGGRALVRFEHGAKPLAMQLYQRASQLLLQHFEPAT